MSQLLQNGGVFTNAARDSINQVLASMGLVTQGNIWWVRPGTGTDSWDSSAGLVPQMAFKTLAFALSRATANQNDIVLLCQEGNTAALTTDYQSTALDWNKDLVHLVGINAGSQFSPRSRVAFASAYNTAAALFTVSANGCRIHGIEFFMGVAGTSPLGAVKVTGQRNHFTKCHMAGIGADTNDVAGAYSLRLAGAEECLFEDCVIGLDTIGGGTAANSEILIDTVSQRNTFRDCLVTRLLDHATNHPMVKLAAATSIDRTLIFERCQFLNQSTNYAIAQAGIFKLVAAITQGQIILKDCMLTKSDNSTAVKWDVDDRNLIQISNTALSSDTSGQGFPT